MYSVIFSVGIVNSLMICSYKVWYWSCFQIVGNIISINAAEDCFSNPS